MKDININVTTQDIVKNELQGILGTFHEQEELTYVKEFYEEVWDHVRVDDPNIKVEELDGFCRDEFDDKQKEEIEKYWEKHGMSTINTCSTCSHSFIVDYDDYKDKKELTEEDKLDRDAHFVNNVVVYAVERNGWLGIDYNALVLKETIKRNNKLYTYIISYLTKDQIETFDMTLKI